MAVTSSLTTYLRRGWFRASDDRLLFAFPLLASLLYVDRLRRILVGADVASIKFGFPTGLGTLDAFVNVPVPAGVTVSPLFVLAPVALAADAALTAGYLARLRATMHSREVDPVEAARDWFVPMFGLVVLDFAIVLLLVLGGVAGSGLLILAIPFLLVLAYLFYAAPYLVVVEDRGAVDALRRSYGLARQGGEYLSFAFQYLLFTAAVSFPLSVVVYNTGIVGLVVGLLATTPLAVAADAATMLFVEDLVGAGGDARTQSDWVEF
ncbi:hypothetical protein [Haloarchaeobius sp. TZWSO28]|uniref:hypothetical protein n=1 Tax=Haloarchaeobius sp. TZWSO28 TaxID=3446119 RepID=UPI003EB898F8